MISLINADCLKRLGFTVPVSPTRILIERMLTIQQILSSPIRRLRLRFTHRRRPSRI